VSDGVIQLGVIDSFDVNLDSGHDVVWDLQTASGSFLNGGTINSVVCKDGVIRVFLDSRALITGQYELKLTSTETDSDLSVPVVREHTFRINVVQSSVMPCPVKGKV
jgi:hypothetical protein